MKNVCLITAFLLTFVLAAFVRVNDASAVKAEPKVEIGQPLVIERGTN